LGRKRGALRPWGKTFGRGPTGGVRNRDEECALAASVGKKPSAKKKKKITLTPSAEGIVTEDLGRTHTFEKKKSSFCVASGETTRGKGGIRVARREHTVASREEREISKRKKGLAPSSHRRSTWRLTER